MGTSDLDASSLEGGASVSRDSMEGSVGDSEGREEGSIEDADCEACAATRVVTLDVGDTSSGSVAASVVP